MIVILTQCFPSRVGGVESLISNLALGLSKKEISTSSLLIIKLIDSEKDELIKEETSKTLLTSFPSI